MFLIYSSWKSLCHLVSSAGNDDEQVKEENIILTELSDGVQDFPAERQNWKTLQESGITVTARSAESEQTAYSTAFHGDTYSSLPLAHFFNLSCTTMSYQKCHKVV